VQIQGQEPGVEVFTDPVLDPAGVVEQGGAGKNADDAVKQGDRDNRPAVPDRRVAGLAGGLDAFHRQLQQPGDQEGKAVGTGEEQGAEKIAAPAFAYIAYEKVKLANGGPCYAA